MITENTFDKSKLISELKEIHIELVKVYKNIFDYKYHISESFKDFIDKEYKENGISSKERQAWNDNFCHRASYTLLNKILFIRICEDKGFMLNSEDYVAGEPKDPHIGKKLSRIGLQKWANLVTNYTLGELVKLAFLDMKKSYSSISLYKDDKYEILTPTTEELSLKYLDGDDEAQKLIMQFENALGNIVEKLDTNNYNFKNTDGNILGDVYERFMDRETRKSIGQFYTPEFVIEYILKNTVAETDVVENPFVSIADISCGSGHFLIMAYDILREKFINNLELLRDKYTNELYTIKKNGKEEELTGRDYWKEENIHFHLLKHCIYGADIDSFAIQLTTINLLLKDLDNFTDELNIVECDSLIKWEEDYDWIDLKQQLEEEFETVEYNQINLLGEEEKTYITQKKESLLLKYKDISGNDITEKIDVESAKEVIKLCQFWAKKFDYIVGNPPYIGFGNKIDKRYIEKNYDCFMGKSDLFIAFIELALNKLKVGGSCGYIFPITFLNHPNNENIRIKILNDAKLKYIVNLGEKIFEDVRKNTMILVFDKDKSNCDYICRTKDVSKLKMLESKIIELRDPQNYNSVMQSQFKKMPLSIIDTYLDERLIDLFLEIYNNNLKIIDLGKALDAGIDYNMKSVSQKVFYNGNKKNENDHEILSGRNINKFVIYKSDKYLINNYKDKIVKGEYIKVNESVYELNEKIIYRQTADRIIATIDFGQRYFDKSVHAIKVDNKKISQYYLIGLLNSSLFKFFYDIFAGGEVRCHSDFPQVKTTFIDNLPIKTDIDLNLLNSFDQLVKEIIESVSEIEQYNFNEIGLIEYIDFEERKLKNELEIFERQIILDLLVYDIYKINYNDIKAILDVIDKEDSQKFKMRLIDFLQKSQICNNDINYIEEVKKLIRIQVEEELKVVSNVLPPEKFRYEHIECDKTLEQIADEYSINYIVLKLQRQLYTEKFSNDEPWKFYNLEPLSSRVLLYLKGVSLRILQRDLEIKHLDTIKECAESECDIFDQLITLYRTYKSNVQSTQIIKETLNLDTYTWNAYRKAKRDNKVNKIFIKYYDNNYYGLAEWPDEIHKNYFIDAIEEYTTNNSNEKKAKDILKLFKDLDIEDKQDYIEVIEEKIRKAFK